jgi:hypothetical protein
MSDTNENIEPINPVPAEKKNDVDPNLDTDFDADEATELEELEELEKLLKQKQELDENARKEREAEEQFKREMEQHIEDTQNNLGIFLSWMRDCTNKKNLYKDFCRDFSSEYRSLLFENICEFFKDEKFVTDEILFYWKYMVVFLLRTSKKYKSGLENLIFNFENKETNFRIVKEKYIFKCFIGEEQLCYFKENGTDYYVS